MVIAAGPGGRPDSPREIAVDAPAKVNLGLRILRRRPDGFHDLDTVFQAVSLFDTVLIRESPPPSPGPDEPVYVAPDGVWLQVAGPWAVPCDESNLALRAARLFAAETGGSLAGLGIRIEKKIPPGGGLAGGSADAAGVLAGLQSLEKADIPEEMLRNWGARLGSDVPFCLVGGTARGGGRGEILNPIARKLEFWMTLVNPGVTVETSKAFAAFDPGRHGRPGDLSPMVEALEAGQSEPFARSLENTFEECLSGAFPQMEAIKRDLETAGCVASLLSGSGATVWGLSWDEFRACRVASDLDTLYPFVETVRPISSGPRVRKKP